MSARAWAVATAAFGVATITLFVIFAMLPEARAAAGCLSADAVVQFELAQNGDDLARIFGGGGEGCGPLAIAAMDAVNRIDLIAFIPLYTAFACAGALFLADGALRPLSVAALGAALGAGAFDYLETTTLLQITQTLDEPEALLPRLQASAWAKFALLAAHGVFGAGLCFLGARRRRVLGSLLLLPVLGVALAAYDHVRLASVMSAAFALAWVALLVTAARSALTGHSTRT